MSGGLDALPDVAASTYDGVASRQQSAGHDPRSGAGARRAGGRFNPPNSFPVLYLCLGADCCAAELRRAARSLGVDVTALLPRELYTYEFSLTRVLDLREEAIRSRLGLDLPALLEDSMAQARSVGVAAFRAEWEAILCPSRTGVGDVIAVFPEHAAGGLHDVRLAEVWRIETDLSPSAPDGDR